MPVRERFVDLEQVWSFETYLALCGFEEVESICDEVDGGFEFYDLWMNPDDAWVEVIWNANNGLLRFGDGAEPLFEDVK